MGWTVRSWHKADIRAARSAMSEKRTLSAKEQQGPY